MSIKWTDKEIDILEKMVVAHKTPEDIVQVLKSRTTDSIRNKVQRMAGLEWTREPEFDMDAFNKLMKGK